MPEALPADLFVAATRTRVQGGTPSEAVGHYATDLGLIAIDTGQEWLCACTTGERARLTP